MSIDKNTPNGWKVAFALFGLLQAIGIVLLTVIMGDIREVRTDQKSLGERVSTIEGKMSVDAPKRNSGIRGMITPTPAE